jgi:hypothetical protein
MRARGIREREKDLPARTRKPMGGISASKVSIRMPVAIQLGAFSRLLGVRRDSVEMAVWRPLSSYRYVP